MKTPSEIHDRLALLKGFLGKRISRPFIGGACWKGCVAGKGSFFRLARFAGATAIAVAVSIGVEGCHTTPEAADIPEPMQAAPSSQQVQETVRSNQLVQQRASSEQPVRQAVSSESLVLHEGDTVRISFPGSPNLNTTQQIRRDGKVSLALVGEFQAAGLTLPEMTKKLVNLYAPQLVTKEVTVALDSSAFVVYVTGAVTRPGRLASDRPLTVLEAVIDAGVDYAKANLKAVTVIRRENGREEHHTLNLKQMLQGRGSAPFYLKPSDIIFVRERFTWF